MNNHGETKPLVSKEIRRGGLDNFIRTPTPEEISDFTFRFPDPLRPLEAPFAHANRRSYDRAVQTLQDAFPTLPLARFSQATDATNLVIGRANAKILDSINAERLLEGLFQTFHFNPTEHIRIIKDKEDRTLGDIAATYRGPFPGERVRMRPAGLAAAIDAGYTLVLDGLELRDPSSIRLAASFERVFACPVNINGYVSARTHTSFGAHWDDHEVVVLQLIGHKNWRIEEPVALSPMKSTHGDDTSARTVWEGQLKPGDAVYIPRGWGHLVRGDDELTFHFTITIPRLNGVTVLSEVLELMGSELTAGLAGSIRGLTADAADSQPVPSFTDANSQRISSTIEHLRASHALRIAHRSTPPPLPFDSTITDSFGTDNAVWITAGVVGNEIIVGSAGSVFAIRCADADVACSLLLGTPEATN